MTLYIPHSIFHLARLLYVRPETFGPYYVSWVNVTALWAICLLCCSKKNCYLRHLLAMQRNFTFVVCITATPAVMISTDESAYSLVLTVSLGIEDFVLYSIEFRL